MQLPIKIRIGRIFQSPYPMLPFDYSVLHPGMGPLMNVFHPEWGAFFAIEEKRWPWSRWLVRSERDPSRTRAISKGDALSWRLQQRPVFSASPSAHESGVNPRVRRPQGIRQKKEAATMIHDRAAKALGWSVRDTQGFSLPTLREMVRTADPALAAEISSMISSGSHIRGSGRVSGSTIAVPAWMLADAKKYGPGTSAATDAALRDRVKSLTRGRRKK